MLSYKFIYVVTVVWLNDETVALSGRQVVGGMPNIICWLIVYF